MVMWGCLLLPAGSRAKPWGQRGIANEALEIVHLMVTATPSNFSLEIYLPQIIPCTPVMKGTAFDIKYPTDEIISNSKCGQGCFQ